MAEKWALVTEAFQQTAAVDSEGCISKERLRWLLRTLDPSLTEGNVLRAVNEFSDTASGSSHVKLDTWLASLFSVTIPASAVSPKQSKVLPTDASLAATVQDDLAQQLASTPTPLRGRRRPMGPSSPCFPRGEDEASGSTAAPETPFVERSSAVGQCKHYVHASEEPELELSTIHPILASCIWHDSLAHFVSMADLCQLCCVASSVWEEVTLESKDGRRLLVAPVAELNSENVELTLTRLSSPHISTLRVWKRTAFDAVADLVEKTGARALQSLQRLAIKGCPLTSSDCRMVLRPVFSHVGGLKHLNLEKNLVDDAMIQELVDSGAFAAARLESLNLRFNRIGPAGAAALASCKKGTERLDWLNLKMNSIGDYGAEALCHMLRDNKSMTLLNLRRQVPPLTDRTAVAFGELLTMNSTLEQLRLRKNKIADKGGAALASGLTARGRQASTGFSESPSRLELDLEDNRLSAKSAVELIKAVGTLETDSLQVELLLHGNPIDRQGMDGSLAGIRMHRALDVDAFFRSKADNAL
eukprot:TRINITY_DN33973_c0_g2_i1.p1 TRINITY_DN33973_c0_g2~~TRINITY_DN33973_c0_g2_i1.p1  ORF type:complete len:530 (+),score=97.46 TRINITY_DN33973_c0_g2_i1:79-1668(+)